VLLGNCLRWSLGRSLFRSGIGLDRLRGDGACDRRVKLRWKRVRAEAKFHERFRFRKAGGGKAVVRLVVEHRGSRVVVPAAGRLSLEVAFANERLLNLLHAPRLQVETR